MHRKRRWKPSSVSPTTPKPSALGSFRKNQLTSKWAVDPDGAGPGLARCLKARLGFLDIEAIDAKPDAERTTIEGKASIKLTGGGDTKITFNELTTGNVDVEAAIGGALRINLALRTGIAGTGTDLPSVLGTLFFGFEANQDNFENAAPKFEFGNLYLDVGTYLARFLKPVVEGINEIIDPFKPIIDVINAPIPVVSDLAALVGEPPVTMIKLLEAATGADLGMVKAILSIIQFVGTIGDLVEQLPENDPSFQLPLGDLLGLNALAADPFEDREPGSFSVDTTKASQATTPENRGSFVTNAKGGDGFVNDIAGNSGLDRHRQHRQGASDDVRRPRPELPVPRRRQPDLRPTRRQGRHAHPLGRRHDGGFGRSVVGLRPDHGRPGADHHFDRW